MPNTLIRPLTGTRILEAVTRAAPLHIWIAVGMAGKIAAELGAEVTLLAPDGDHPLRISPPFLQGTEGCSALFEFLHGAKTIVSASSEDNLHAHATDVDALLVDAAAALPRDKAAVVVSSFGPWQTELKEPASELTIMALSGVLHLVGLQAGTPMRLPGHQPAYAAGLAAFLAMSAALMAPVPRIADVSLLDAVLWVNWKVISEPLLAPPAAGKVVNEWQVLEATDGHIALVYMDRDWPALVDLIGDPRLRDPRFSTRPSRLEHLDDLMAVLRPWIAARSKADIYREAKLRSIPLGPVWSVADLVRDAQFLERDFWANTSAGMMPRLPVMWNNARPRAANLG